MSQAIRTSRYQRRIPNYSSYTRVKGKSNGNSIIAKKIIIQSLICMAIVFSVAYLQSRVEELPQNIVSKIRLIVVERNISNEDIYQTFANAYEECVDYIQGAD